MKIDWVKHDRKAVAVELLTEAARTIDSRGSIAVAVTLARAGAQAFADRVVRAGGGDSALKLVAGLVAQHAGADFGWRWLREIVHGRSNAIKHGGHPDEPEEVLLSYELAEMLVIAGTADCRKLLGEAPPALVEFTNRVAAAMVRRLGDPRSIVVLSQLLPAAEQAGEDWRRSPD